MRGKHDALQLYDLLKEHLARPVRHASQSQIAANAQFQKLLRDDANNSSIRRLGREDARAMSREEFLVLLILLYRVFFPGQYFVILFDFLRPETRVQGDRPAGIYCTAPNPSPASKYPRYAMIRLDPLLVDNRKRFWVPPPNSVLNQASMSQLDILLHELCHVYLDWYTCEDCTSKSALVMDLKGHGVAQQRTGLSVEHAAQKQLNFPVDLGRFEAVCHPWKNMKQWPAIHEVEAWQLTDLLGHEEPGALTWSRFFVGLVLGVLVFCLF